MPKVPTPTCAYCNEDAPWLCDYVICWVVDPKTRLMVPTLEQITCDLPLCHVHTTKQHGGFICRPCRAIVYDFCPEHPTGNLLGDHPHARMTREEGEKARDVLHAKVRDKVLLHSTKTMQLGLDL